MSHARKFKRKTEQLPLFEGVFNEKYPLTPERKKASEQVANKLRNLDVNPEWVAEMMKLDQAQRIEQVRQVLEMIVIETRKLN